MIDDLDLLTLPAGSSILLYCRPRMAFHLGHLRMLNVLYSLLSAGHHVTVMTIPYVEHEERNRTFRQRLNEDQALTHAFYAGYLGFRPPQLRMLSADDLDLSSTTKLYEDAYASLAYQGSPGVRTLIDNHPHQWTSPNIPFVGKALAAIDAIGADISVCGKKHEPISTAFDEVLQNVGTCSTKAHTFADLLDLRLRTGMDRTDSASTYIELTDQPDFVLSKLHTVRDALDSNQSWLAHFERLVLYGLPVRLREDIPSQCNDDYERTFALIQLIKNAYRYIPYALQPSADDFILEFGSHGDQLGSRDRELIRRLSQRLFPSLGVSKATIFRLHTSGRSGSAVLGVREVVNTSPPGGTTSRNSVLKIGDPSDLHAEKDAYERYITPKRSSAFTEVLTASSLSDGSAAIVYRDAAAYAGVEGPIDDLFSLLRPTAARGRFQEVFHTLVNNHLYPTLYSMGRLQDSGSLSHVINEFWPADLHLEARSFGDMAIEHGADEENHAVEWRTVIGVVTEVRPHENFVRVYTEHSHAKIDLDVARLPEHARARCTVGARIRVHGTVLRTRSDFFAEAFGALGEPELTPSFMRTYIALERLARADQSQFRLSPVHGDLHAGNVLVADGRPYIIDYGKVRGDYPSLYDLATLIADLKVRLYAERLHHGEIEALERSLAENRRPLFGTSRDIWSALTAMEYSNWSPTMQSLGGTATYHLLLGGISLGRLKFDSTIPEKRAAVELAKSCVGRIGGRREQSGSPLKDAVRVLRARTGVSGSTKSKNRSDTDRR